MMQYNNRSNRRNNSQSRESQEEKEKKIKEKVDNNFPELNELSGEILGKKAEEIADIIKKDGQISKNQLSKHQLRKFYGEVKDIQRILLTKQDSEREKQWKTKLLPRYSMIKAKAYYNTGTSSKIPISFLQFLVNGIDKVGSNLDRFQNFCLFFEAVVGYLYGKGGVKQS